MHRLFAAVVRPYSTVRIASLLGGLLVVGLTVGCGQSGPARVAVSGTVTFNGKPLSTGNISLIPVGEGTGGSAEIKDGAFSIPADAGPSPGSVRVEITSFQETGRKIPGISDDGSGMTAEKKQVVPAKYNAQSTLTETLKDGSNELKFDL